MSNEPEGQPEQLGSMTTDQITARMQDHQQHINIFLDHLILRASIQGYTEQQHDELLTLVQEAVTYLEEVPVPLEWRDRRNELIMKLREKL